jgi:hypothetical protein
MLELSNFTKNEGPVSSGGWEKLGEKTIIREKNERKTK